VPTERCSIEQSTEYCEGRVVSSDVVRGDLTDPKDGDDSFLRNPRVHMHLHCFKTQNFAI
jgi:hypothetical protein